MNPRIRKAIDDIERTRTKITELQALLPELERKKTDLEDAEIIRLVRRASVRPGDLYTFMESMNQTSGAAPVKSALVPVDDTPASDTSETYSQTVNEADGQPRHITH